MLEPSRRNNYTCKLPSESVASPYPACLTAGCVCTAAPSLHPTPTPLICSLSSVSERCSMRPRAGAVGPLSAARRLARPSPACRQAGARSSPLLRDAVGERLPSRLAAAGVRLPAGAGLGCGCPSQACQNTARHGRRRHGPQRGQRAAGTRAGPPRTPARFSAVEQHILRRGGGGAAATSLPARAAGGGEQLRRWSGSPRRGAATGQRPRGDAGGSRACTPRPCRPRL